VAGRVLSSSNSPVHRGTVSAGFAVQQQQQQLGATTRGAPTGSSSSSSSSWDNLKKGRATVPLRLCERVFKSAAMGDTSSNGCHL
jgi:hypothetical protein